MKNREFDTDHVFQLECNGFDEDLRFQYFKDGLFVIDHNIPSFYANQRPIWNYFKRMFSMIWCAITNQQYKFFEVVILPERMDEFKKWVAEL